MVTRTDGESERRPEALAVLAAGFEQLGMAVVEDERAVEQVLQTLARIVAGTATVLAADGSVRAQAVSDRDGSSAPAAEAPMARATIVVDAAPVGTLVIAGPEAHLALASFAATLLGGALSRRTATLSDRQRLATRILHDVLAGGLPDGTVIRRLASFGITFDTTNRVLIGRTAEGFDGPSYRIDELFAPAGQPLLRGIVGGELVIVVPSRIADEAVVTLYDELTRRGRTVTVGVGGDHATPVGLRVSYAEARAAAQGDPGIRPCEPLFLANFVRLEEPEPVLAELATTALAALVAHDTRTTSVSAGQGDGLVATLENFLASDCSFPRTAERMHLHPNTVRYRIRQVEAITGKDLSLFRTRAHFWLALAAVRH